jgi:hypothetical protein
VFLHSNHKNMPDFILEGDDELIRATRLCNETRALSLMSALRVSS